MKIVENAMLVVGWMVCVGAICSVAWVILGLTGLA